MSNNNNKEMKDNKPLLWESWMSLEDYKIRQSFYNGTAQPRPSPISRPPDGDEVLSSINYPLFDDYDDSNFSLVDTLLKCEPGICLNTPNYLMEYSLYGLEAIDIYD